MEARRAAKKSRRRQEKDACLRRALASQKLTAPPITATTIAPNNGLSAPSPYASSALQLQQQQHAFEVGDERDHAETPFEAYRDLEPLLYRLAVLAGRTKATLRVR